MVADRDRSARARQRQLYCCVADNRTLRGFGELVVSANPSNWPGYPEQVAAARSAADSRHAVTTGLATVAGEPCVMIGFEFSFLGGSVGVAEGSKIEQAFSHAVTEHLPVVSVAASGGSRMQEGTSALVQMQVVAAAVERARRAGVPHIAVAGDPTTGGVWSSLIAGADLLISVPGARISFSGSRTRPLGADPDSRLYLADGQWAHGFVDVLSRVADLRAIVGTGIRLLSPRSRGKATMKAPVPGWPLSTDCGPPAAAPEPQEPGSTWAHVRRARSHRPRADHWLAAYFSSTIEIRGDRSGGVDASLRCGFGDHHGVPIGYVAQTGERTTAAGFRTASRLIRLADRLGLPVLTLIDTPGAASAPSDEAAGIGPAIADLFAAVAASSVPITSVVIGQGVSGGALALASPTDLWITADGYLAVTAPELAASILKLGPADIPTVADQLRLTPPELLNRGIVRGIIMPGAGAHG